MYALTNKHAGRKEEKQGSRARRAASAKGRRNVIISSSEKEEVETLCDRTPGPDAPSTNGIQVREVVTLGNPVRIVDKKKESSARMEAGDEADTEVDTEEGSDDEDDQPPQSSAGEGRRPRKIIKPRGRGKPLLDPAHAGQFTDVKLREKAEKRKRVRDGAKEDEALDPSTELRRGPRLKAAKREEKEMIEELKEISSAGVTAVVNEQVVTLRKVAQTCTNLKGTTVKTLWKPRRASRQRRLCSI